MEKILNILKRNNSKTSQDTNLERENLLEKYSILKKREEFFKWLDNLEYSNYYKEIVLNFINKMAIWYEFRFPNSEIDNIFEAKDTKGSILEVTNKSEGCKDLLYFSLDDNVKDNLSNTLWSDLFDTKTFLNTLSNNEKDLLEKPKFPNHFSDYNLEMSFDLSANGKILEIICRNHPSKLPNEEVFGFKNKNIEELLLYLKENNIESDDIECVVDCYKKKNLFKEKLLDNVLYRIIELGGDDYGVKRGYLFALEFKRNLDIPLTYYSPLYECNRILLNDYLKNGGNENLTCARGYFINNIEEIKLREFYNLKSSHTTHEELDMYKKIVTILKIEVLRNLDELKQLQEEKNSEEIEQKRLQKRLEKSKNRS